MFARRLTSCTIVPGTRDDYIILGRDLPVQDVIMKMRILAEYPGLHVELALVRKRYGGFPPPAKLPDGNCAVASLIANQASNIVAAALADRMATQARTQCGDHCRTANPPLCVV